MEELKKAIEESGISITFIAEQLGVTRRTVYSKIDGRAEWKASEIVKMGEILHLSAKKRNEIFLS